MTIAFAAILVVAVGLLVVVVATGPLADAWHPVVSIDGTSLNRSDLRARMALDAVIVEARRASIRSLVAANQITAADAARAQARVDASAADPLRMAIDGLTADVVLRSEAASRGIPTGADIGAELTEAASADVAQHVSALTVDPPNADATPAGDWPPPALLAASSATFAASRAAAIDRARDALAAGANPDDVAEALSAAGWRAKIWDTWLPATGPVDGLPDRLVATLRDPATPIGSLVGPVADPTTGGAAIGYRIDVGTRPIPPAIAVDGIDGETVRRWAESRVAERGLRDSVVGDALAGAQPMVRAAELVIGPAAADDASEYRSFAQVLVNELPRADHGSGTDLDAGTRLAHQLTGLSRPERRTRFDALLAGARAESGAAAASGETGYYTRDQLLPTLAAVAFRDGVARDDVLGPIDTPAGPALFMVRSGFKGVLDERSNAALVEARSTDDLKAMAHRVSPVGEWPRADGSLWRSAAELVGDPAVAAAYADTPIGAMSDPFVLDGELLVVRPLERADRPLDPDASGRVSVRGFDAWLAGRLGTAAITRDPEPLPGVVVASPSPSVTDGPLGSPGVIPTPNLPVR